MKTVHVKLLHYNIELHLPTALLYVCVLLSRLDSTQAAWSELLDDEGVHSGVAANGLSRAGSFRLSFGTYVCIHLHTRTPLTDTIVSVHTQGTSSVRTICSLK